MENSPGKRENQWNVLIITICNKKRIRDRGEKATNP